MSFLFLQTGYDTGVRNQDNGTVAQKTGKGVSVVFLTQPLQYGNELVLHVTRSNVQSHGDAAGIKVGVTTCPPSKIQQYSSHASGECNSGTCGGQSVLLSVQERSQDSKFQILVKRTAHQGQIYVQSGRWHVSMAGMKFGSVGKLFPFLVMDGQVMSVRIGSESIREIGTLGLIPVSGSPVSRVAVTSPPVTSPARQISFMIPPRPERREAGKYRSNLKYNMHGTAKRVIFLNADIKIGEPLNLRITETKQRDSSAFSFIFGVTTCNRTTFDATYLHDFDYSSPAICGNHSKHCELPPLAVGDTVTIERVEEEFIRFTIGSEVYSLDDETGIFNDKKCFPYVMLSGSVFALEIVNTGHGDSLVSDSSLRAEANDGDGYAFLTRRQSYAAIVPTKIVSSQMQGVRIKMTFIDRPLIPGKRLVIRVTRKHREQDICFTFGVTTCDRTSWDKPFAHQFNFSKPSTCRGHERHCEIPDFDVGSEVSFERKDDKQFILITFGPQSFSLPDPNGIFRNKMAFPFVMVNGSAYALEIIPDQNIPSIPKNNEILPIHRFSNASSIQVSNASSLTSLHEVTHMHKKPDNCNPVPIRPVAVVQSAKPVTETVKGINKWYGNPTVSFTNSVMTRCGEADDLCFIFGAPFSPGDGFSFRVQKLDTSVRGSLCFGVTRVPIVLVDVENVPQASDDKWLINKDVIPVIAINQVMIIRRNESEITLTDGHSDPVRLFRLPSDVKVHPFFRLNGSVQEIQILS